jgi:hypothetical protein
MFHWIKHLLKINTGKCHSWWNDGKLMMSFKCDGCGKLSGIHEVPDEITYPEKRKQ